MIKQVSEIEFMSASKKRGNGQAKNDMLEFVRSNMQFAEIEVGDRDPNAVAAHYLRASKDAGLYEKIRVTRKRERVFLVRKGEKNDA